MNETRQVIQSFSTDQPEVHVIAEKMRKLADAYGDRVLIGEIYLPLERLMHYYGREAPGVHLPFNFQPITAPWHAGPNAGRTPDYAAALPPPGWPTGMLGHRPDT